MADQNEESDAIAGQLQNPVQGFEPPKKAFTYTNRPSNTNPSVSICISDMADQNEESDAIAGQLQNPVQGFEPPKKAFTYTNRPSNTNPSVSICISDMADQNEESDAIAGQLQNPVQGFEPPKKAFAFACAIFAILAGYNTGVMSAGAIFVKHDLKLTGLEFKIFMASAVVLNTFVGLTSYWLGRRNAMVCASAAFSIGPLLLGFATNYALLMVGRFVTAIGVGYALIIAPAYAAEVSPASTRDFLTSFVEVFINAGILLGYVSNYAFSKLPIHLGWRFMLGFGAIPSVFLAAVVFKAMPESPCGLVMQGRPGDAERVLFKFSDSEAGARSRHADIKTEPGITEHNKDGVVQVQQRPHGVAPWKDLILHPTPSIRHKLIVAVCINLFQQSTGIGAVVLYGPTIFEKAGIKNENQKLLAIVVVGFVKTAFAAGATLAIDKIGRRPLLLGSFAGLILSLVGLGLGLTIIDRTDEKRTWATAICISTVLSYVAFFSIGVGPITRIYSSESFPLTLRAQVSSMGLLMNTVASGILLMTFIPLCQAISIGGAFFCYAGIALVAWIFVYKLLPETKGLTLEQMESRFGF